MGDYIMNEWISVSEVAKKTNIPEATVRRYIREHGFHLRVKKGHKSYQIYHESIDTLNQIREMYGKGLNMDEVNNMLADNKPMIITVNEQDERMAVNVAEALMELKRSMDERMNGMNAEIVRLRQELAISQEQLHDYNQLKYEMESLRHEAATTAEHIEQGLKDNTQLKQQNQQLHLEIESVQKRVAATHQTMDAIRKEMAGFIAETRTERIQREESEKKGFFARLFGR